MLDTNTVSQIIRSAPATIRGRLAATPMADVCISAITEGELRFGLARRPEAVRLAEAVGEFLLRVDILPWDSAAAASYGLLRRSLEAAETPLGALDTLIAAHAMAVDAVLVTSDVAFSRAPGLAVEDWAAP